MKQVLSTAFGLALDPGVNAPSHVGKAYNKEKEKSFNKPEMAAKDVAEMEWKLDHVLNRIVLVMIIDIYAHETQKILDRNSS